MQTLLTQNFVLKVPKNLILFYSEKQLGVVLQHKVKKKFLILLLKIFLNVQRHFIYVTSYPLLKLSKFFKNLLLARVKCFTLLKKGIIETLTVPFKKIFFFGVGFKVSLVQNANYSLFKLTLGFSHDIFIVLTNILEACCLKLGYFLIFTNFYNNVYFLGSKLLSVRKMNSYKLKGFSYEHKTFFPSK